METMLLCSSEFYLQPLSDPGPLPLDDPLGGLLVAGLVPLLAVVVVVLPLRAVF